MCIFFLFSAAFFPCMFYRHSPLKCGSSLGTMYTSRSSSFMRLLRASSLDAGVMALSLEVELVVVVERSVSVTADDACNCDCERVALLLAPADDAPPRRRSNAGTAQLLALVDDQRGITNGLPLILPLPLPLPLPAEEKH
jgi:hypothetical protein